MLFKLLAVIALVRLASLAWGYSTIPGDLRLVKGQQNAQFNYKTTLPGYYTSLRSGIITVTLVNGNCSSPFFLCSYSLDDDTQMTVQMAGFMSWGLKWVTFFGGDDLIPISVVFFTGDIWNDLASGSIQPQYSLPLIIGAKGLATVSFTCVILSTSPKYELFLDNNKTLYYSNENQNVVDKTQEFLQILNYETKDVLLHKVITVTVREKNPIDFYACNTGEYWLTHTIDWNRSKADLFKTSAAVVLASLIFAGF